MTVVDTFTIPEDIAKRLTELMAIQVINDRILASVADQPDKYDALILSQVKIQREFDQIKYKITDEFVPDKYRDQKYSWNYNGYDVAQNTVEIVIS